MTLRDVTGLTPYDTGDRLEPRPWVTPAENNPTTAADRFGRVDFDSDEGATLATVWIERDPDGTYHLHAYLSTLMALTIDADFIPEVLPDDVA